LRDHEEEFRRKNVQIAVVTFENDRAALNYAEETSLKWPVLIDETRGTYMSYGMLLASFLDIWGPKTWWAYAKELLRGQKLKKTEGDISQRGGDVLIDPAGIIRFHHIGKGPADRPSAETILKNIAG
jgi:peroxiredoxin